MGHIKFQGTILKNSLVIAVGWKGATGVGHYLSILYIHVIIQSELK